MIDVYGYGRLYIIPDQLSVILVPAGTVFHGVGLREFNSVVRDLLRVDLFREVAQR